MPTFPRNEIEIVALTQTISAGLKANPTVFPNPPVVAADLDAQVLEYQQFRDSITASDAVLKQQHIDKDENLEAMEEMSKSIIRYAEMIAKGDAAVLAMVGWGNPSPPTALQPPEQCRALEVIGQGDGWVRLDWKEPVGGGKVAAYKVQRSEDGTNFTDAMTVTVSEAALFDQPKMKTLIYHVVAINKAGEGMPSNTISIVL